MFRNFIFENAELQDTKKIRGVECKRTRETEKGSAGQDMSYIYLRMQLKRRFDLSSSIWKDSLYSCSLKVPKNVLITMIIMNNTATEWKNKSNIGEIIFIQLSLLSIFTCFTSILHLIIIKSSFPLHSSNYNRKSTIYLYLFGAIFL